MTISYKVTRQVPVFGSREATTGWRLVTWNPTGWDADTTDEMMISQRGSSGFYTPAGYYGKISALGQCADPVDEGDHILTEDGRTYHVEYVEPVWDGDNFVRRDCALTHVPLYEAMPSTGTWSLTRLSPARHKTKEFIDDYCRDAQLTKDDDSTEASWACIWANPPYHLHHEFRAAANAVQGLYVLSKEVKTPLIGIRKTAHHYALSVPTHILTVDSTDCTGEFLAEKMEEELEYIYRTEASAAGSKRMPERVHEPREMYLGGMKVIDIEYRLHYWRRIT